MAKGGGEQRRATRSRPGAAGEESSAPAHGVPRRQRSEWEAASLIDVSQHWHRQQQFNIHHLTLR